MPAHARQRTSRRYIWQGCVLLAVGSALLLGCKLSVSPWLHSVLLFSGGGAILLGNGYMLYGLLHHADSRTYANDSPQEKREAYDTAVPETSAPQRSAPAKPALTAGRPDEIAPDALAPAAAAAQDNAQSTARKA